MSSTRGKSCALGRRMRSAGAQTKCMGCLGFREGARRLTVCGRQINGWARRAWLMARVVDPGEPSLTLLAPEPTDTLIPCAKNAGISGCYLREISSASVRTSRRLDRAGSWALWRTTIHQSRLVASGPGEVKTNASFYWRPLLARGFVRGF